jgi:hypothetical protein
MAFTDNCMVVNLQIKCWTARRLDKGATTKLTKDAGADADAASVNKHIIPKDALVPLTTAARVMRDHFNTNTLPWKDNGDRLLPRTAYTRFVMEHSELKRAFEKEVATFIDTTYTVSRERAAFRMGDLFNENDYPPVNELRRKYAVSLDIDPVTEAGDFRVALNKDELTQARAALEASMQSRMQRAIGNIWDRIAETVGAFAERMDDSTEKKTFRDTCVTNLEDLAALLPDLNITDDPAVNTMIEEIRTKLVGYDPETLRKNPVIRQEAATEAQKIMDTMKGFMNAFGQAA